MKIEELMKMLHDAGLDDVGIKELLTEALASLPAEEPSVMTEEDEKKEAGKLFGVDFD